MVKHRLRNDPRDHRSNPYRDNDVVACEICGTEKKFSEMKSLTAMYRMPGDHPSIPGAKRPGWIGCATDLQHFGCCHEHALLAHLHCLFEHIHNGPHSESGTELQHDKLKRIIAILDENLIEDLHDNIAGVLGGDA